jgi:hypothetical protein
MRGVLYSIWLLGLLALGATHRAQPVPDKALPPSPPLSGTPVDWFRQLLSMTPIERERALAEADRTEDQKQVLRAKVLEYEALPVAERERRLHAIQLRMWISKLLPMAPSNRVERLAAIPEVDRQVVIQRLDEWDKLPQEEQQEFLNNPRLIYIARARSDRSLASSNLLGGRVSAQRERLEQDLARLGALAPDRRERVLGNFEKFLQLPDKDKARALDGFSDADRKQMETTLEDFRKLPREQRLACIKAFDKLARMSKSERDQFLENAELWQAMSPADRAMWRRLVTSLPPLPPERLPPIPPTPGRSGVPMPPDHSEGAR